MGLGILPLLGRSDAGSACGRRDRGAIPQRRGGYKEALRGRMVPSGSTGSTGCSGASGAQWAERPERPAKLRKTSDADGIGKDGKDGNEEQEPKQVSAPSAPSAPSCPSEAKCVEDWATGLVQAALLRVLKKRAAAAEEFDVAARLKARERGAETTLAAGRARAMQPLDEGIL